MTPPPPPSFLLQVGPYYSTGFKPTTLFADNKNARAWPGGTGFAKLGGNYAPTIRHLVRAAAAATV